VTETSQKADPPESRWRSIPPRWARLVLPAAALAVALAACGQGPGPGDQTTDVPSADQSGVGETPLAAYNMTPIGGRFVGDDNGFLVRTRCTVDGCAYELLSTVDGGQTWKTAAVPGAPVVSAPLDDANAVVLPGGQVVTEIQVADERPARHTNDRGVSWPAQVAEPTGVTNRVPDNSALVAFCPQSIACSEPVLRVVRPNGSSSSYGPPPSTLAETVSATRVSDGALWVQGRDGVGRVLLAVSHDEGAHWTMHRVPAPAAASVDIAGGGKAAWALALTDPDTGTTAGSGGTVSFDPSREMRQSLLYSSNSGASFSPVKVPDAYRINKGSGIGVTESGNAVISAAGKVAVISPDGTVTAVTAVHGGVYDLGGRVLVFSPEGSWTSSDGENWSKLPSS
jgi:hypothetical protein